MASAFSHRCLSPNTSTHFPTYYTEHHQREDLLGALVLVRLPRPGLLHLLLLPGLHHPRLWTTLQPVVQDGRFSIMLSLKPSLDLSQMGQRHQEVSSLCACKMPGRITQRKWSDQVLTWVFTNISSLGTGLCCTSCARTATPTSSESSSRSWPGSWSASPKRPRRLQRTAPMAMVRK